MSADLSMRQVFCLISFVEYVGRSIEATGVFVVGGVESCFNILTNTKCLFCCCGRMLPKDEIFALEPCFDEIFALEPCFGTLFKALDLLLPTELRGLFDLKLIFYFFCYYFVTNRIERSLRSS
jgi:hypothetical protein